MPLFPRIAGACPYERDLDAVIVDDWCRMCKRRVVDLTHTSDAEKAQLFAGCGNDVPCVSYRLPVAAAALAMTAIGAAAAQKEHPGKHHAARTRVAVAPVIIMPTAGIPAMPVQWHGGEPAPAKPDPTGGTETTPPTP